MLYRTSLRYYICAIARILTNCDLIIDNRTGVRYNNHNLQVRLRSPASAGIFGGEGYKNVNQTGGDMATYFFSIALNVASIAYLVWHYAWRCQDGYRASATKLLVAGIGIASCGFGFNFAITLLAWLGEI